MGVYQYITGAVSCSNGTNYTGSFCRITALGANDAEVELSRVEFGILADPEADTNITSVAGKIILNFQNVTSQYNRLMKKSFSLRVAYLLFSKHFLGFDV